MNWIASVRPNPVCVKNDRSVVESNSPPMISRKFTTIVAALEITQINETLMMVEIPTRVTTPPRSGRRKT